MLFETYFFVKTQTGPLKHEQFLLNCNHQIGHGFWRGFSWYDTLQNKSVDLILDISQLTTQFVQ